MSRKGSLIPGTQDMVTLLTTGFPDHKCTAPDQLSKLELKIQKVLELAGSWHKFRALCLTALQDTEGPSVAEEMDNAGNLSLYLQRNVHI